jgi:hypothetical protein
MKNILITLASLLLCSVNLIAIDATLTDDVSVTIGPRTVKYYPWAPRLRVDKNHVTLIRFDIASVVPAGTAPADVKKAVLKVWINQSRDFGAGNFLLSKVTSSWSEYGGQPNPGQIPMTGGPAQAGTIDSKKQNTFLTFDVTALVQEWVAGSPNFGIALRGTDAIIGTPEDPVPIKRAVGMWIDSKENKASAHEPTLQISLK